MMKLGLKFAKNVEKDILENNLKFFNQDYIILV